VAWRECTVIANKERVAVWADLLQNPTELVPDTEE